MSVCRIKEAIEEIRLGKMVILVDELKYPPGIYGYNPLDISELEKPIEGKLKSALSILSSTLGISSGALTLG